MTPKNVTIAAQELRRRKTLLEAKLKELCDISPEREELRIESEADPMDQVCSSADRELAIRRIGFKTWVIQEIQAALIKIGRGTYGVCEECEEPISGKRLGAASWAPLCAACQSAGEATQLQMAA